MLYALEVKFIIDVLYALEVKFIIDVLYALEVKFIIKGDILGSRTAFLYFEAPFIVTVYFISMQNT